MYIKYCSICLEKINKCERNITLTECNHTFHKKCLKQWLNKNNTCPNCRIPLSLPKKCDNLNQKCNTFIDFNNRSYNYCCNNIKNFVSCNHLFSVIYFIILLISSIFILFALIVFLPLICGIIIILLINIFVDINIKNTNLYIIYLIGFTYILITSSSCYCYCYKYTHINRRQIHVSI